MKYYGKIQHEKDLVTKEYGIKNRMFTEGLLMESITFDDWIKEVMSKYA